MAGINIRPYAWMCMNSAKWQDIAVDQVRKSLDLNPAGIFLDECQWHGSNAFYCFDPTHGLSRSRKFGQPDKWKLCSPAA
jgi:hypothetical protein